ncbi:XTP/dITP diphosphatase [Thaumasiovibrio subtropicus]|uniref:XTP/dITP diphosphatase n=1 Tax=Thaumasiovibrio subtropicus TaxID=1891207 RepID=UPI000B34B396|nr:XTP/dITP diphosphatase [Thaumasiovibrio subtropicus]
MAKLVLATGNKGKVREMADLLAEFGFDVSAQSEFNVTDVPETGTTFVENAIIKARHAAKVTGLPAIADDSGLEVDALMGAPGVYSARYAGEKASDQDNIDKLLAAMQGQSQRSARFHCVLVLMRHADDPTPLICHGSWEGEIAEQASGSEGFGYDPVFIVPDLACTAAEMPQQEKKKRSHRGQALKALFDALQAQQ